MFEEGKVGRYSPERAVSLEQLGEALGSRRDRDMVNVFCSCC